MVLVAGAGDDADGWRHRPYTLDGVHRGTRLVHREHHRRRLLEMQPAQQVGPARVAVEHRCAEVAATRDQLGVVLYGDELHMVPREDLADGLAHPAIAGDDHVPRQRLRLWHRRRVAALPEAMV